MLLLILISIVLNSLLLHTFKTKLYEDDEFVDKLVLPNWAVLLLIIASLIPVIGIIFFAVMCIVFSVALYNEEIYYKPGWFIKFLLKEH